MLFYSNEFIVFFLLFFPIFCCLPATARIWYVFLASVVFYAWWSPPYILLLLAFIACGYALGLTITRLNRGTWMAALVLIFVPLVLFKYWIFLWNNWRMLWGHADAGGLTPWMLPLGISFITFTVTAYVADVRRGQAEPERNFGRFALFITFFPHLIAGPIMRARELLPQFRHLRVRKKFLKLGLFLYAVGMVKKVVFADQIGVYVDQFYDSAAPGNLWTSLFALYGFAVQIYCDFSGYVDMAYGLAFMMGIRLPLNFNRPYAAVSIRDFWQRWHMTLSRWLRDYLYIPLGGNRKGHARTLVNVMITMLLGGIWHGASWMFVAWGALHGSYIIIELLCRRWWERLPMPKWVGLLLTFHSVALAWLLFRAKDLDQLRHVWEGFFTPAALGPFVAATMFPLLLVVVFFMLHRFDRVSLGVWATRRFSGLVMVMVSLGLIVISKIFSIGAPNAFIYFDF